MDSPEPGAHASAEQGDPLALPATAPGDAAAMYESESEAAIAAAEDYDAFEPNFLPPFANAENKNLNRHIQKLEKLLDDTEAGLDEVTSRTSVMDEHLKSVQNELTYTQARVTSKGKEVKCEEHIKALAEREDARLRSDVKTFSKERNTLLEKISGLQNQIYRANERMDQFKVLMNWNQEELEQWALTQQQKEEDNEAIERYRAQDASKINELNLATERMNKKVFSKKAELEREVTDTQAAQVQLDKAANDFSKLHKERQDLIRQWDDAMKQMRRNDEAIQFASEAFADKKSALRELQARLDVSAKFLDDEMSNNKERDAQISLLDRDIERLRSVHSGEQDKLTKLSEQVELLKSTLNKAGNDHVTSLAEIKGLTGELEKKRVRLDDMRQTLAANTRKLEGEYAHLDSLEERESELAHLRELEVKRMSQVERQLRELEKLQFKKSQDLFSQRSREKDLISEISGGQAQNRTLVAKIQQLDEQVIRQQELLYNVEFQMQLMERKVSRARGERSDKETAVLNEKIMALTQQLEGVNAQHGMLLGQVKKAEDDLGHAIAANTRLLREREKIGENMSALTLETDTLARSLKASTSAKQARMVDADVRQLEVKHLRDVLNSRADEVYSLENRKFQLQQSLAERRGEIDVHKKSLDAELKLLKDDLHRVTLELQERRMRVSRLESKFEVLADRKKSVYAEDEPRSQAYYVIKAAQEREELQAKGDSLDRQVQRLQKEVGALERTLQQMVGSNTNYSKSFKPVPEKRAFGECAKLREQLDKTYDRLKFKRQEERNIAGDIEQAQARLRQISEERDGLDSIKHEFDRRRLEAEAAVRDQEERLEHAMGRFQHAASDSTSSDALADIQVAVTTESNEAMLHELYQLAAERPALGIEEALEAVGLQLPRARESGLFEASGRADSRPRSAASFADGILPARSAATPA